MFMEEMTQKAANLGNIKISENEELYKDVTDVKLRNKAIIKLQAFFRGRQARKYTKKQICQEKYYS